MPSVIERPGVSGVAGDKYRKVSDINFPRAFDLCKHGLDSGLDSGLADWNLDCPLDSGLDFEMEF